MRSHMSPKPVSTPCPPKEIRTERLITINALEFLGRVKEMKNHVELLEGDPEGPQNWPETVNG